jgi:prepilin-type N-terminal cleavage/methylation domain-containing protein
VKRGFTLIEVMFALALLGLALVVLIKSAAGSVFNAEQAHMMGVVTDLGRAEMNEIEETMLKDGFQDTDQIVEGKNFEEMGWPNVKYSYSIFVVEMPTFDQLTAMATGSGAGSGSNRGSAYGSGYGSSYGSSYGSGFGSGFGSGSNFTLSNGTVDPLSTFQNSALGGMMTMMGGLSGGKDIAGAGAGALIQSQYTMFQEILKDSVRKVTLHITYQVLGSDRSLDFVAFYTDPSAMDRTLNGLGAVDSGSGSATGSGSGSGKGSGSATRTTTPSRTGSGS